jgi:hypothetical protein
LNKIISYRRTVQLYRNFRAVGSGGDDECCGSPENLFVEICGRAPDKFSSEVCAAGAPFNFSNKKKHFDLLAGLYYSH